MTIDNRPGPVDLGPILAAAPTVEDLIASDEAAQFRDFIHRRIDDLGLADELAWFLNPEAVDEHAELVTFSFTTSHGAELGTEYAVALLQHVEEVLAEDPRLTRLVCEAVLELDVRGLLRQFVQASMVAPLRMEISETAQSIVELVETIATSAGPAEFEVHRAFTGLSGTWFTETGHHNALLAVYECVDTDNASIQVAAHLLETSFLYETRLKPFMLTLDGAMATAGFMKPDNKPTVGKALQRVTSQLSAKLPQYAHLLDPRWKDLRNAALHGSIRRQPGAPGELITVEKPGDRQWSVDAATAELARLHDLVAPTGAIPQAVMVLASKFTLRFREQVENAMVAQYEPMLERARAWLAENPLPARGDA